MYDIVIMKGEVMRKRISIVLTLCLALCMTMVMTTECFASMPSAKNEIAVKKKIETTVKKNGIKKSVSLKKTVSDKAKKVSSVSAEDKLFLFLIKEVYFIFLFLLVKLFGS